jgi:hypothetical protein
MGVLTNEWEANSARSATELHRYDKELLGANWKPAIGVLALSCGHADKELRPKLPEDSAELAQGFVIQLRVLASRI